MPLPAFVQKRWHVLSDRSSFLPQPARSAPEPALRRRRALRTQAKVFVFLLPLSTKHVRES